MPFSVAWLRALLPPAASGVELIMLDNRYDADVAFRRREICRKRVDLAIEFQVEDMWRPVWRTSSKRLTFPAPSTCPP